MNKTPFDVTKPVQTRDGHKAVIVYRDLQGARQTLVAVIDYPDFRMQKVEYYYTDGRWTSQGECALDLVNIPEKREVWVNFYLVGSGSSHPSRSMADRAAAPGRSACIRVEFTEGEGL